MRIEGIQFNKPAQPETEDQKLREACKDFESVFVRQLLSEMRATVPKSDLLGSREEELYQDMLDTEMSKDIGRAGTLKLGDLLYDQLRVKSNE
jgi:flagellar protein FlgJ